MRLRNDRFENPVIWQKRPELRTRFEVRGEAMARKLSEIDGLRTGDVSPHHEQIVLRGNG
jgi:hypothetical protein